MLKPDVVLFGELLPERAMLRATALASNAGLMLAIGSSLEVWPVAELPADTLRAGGKLALVTMGPTPYDREAAVKLSGDVEQEMQAVLAALGGCRRSRARCNRHGVRPRTARHRRRSGRYCAA